jgi:hypothetical protein
MLSQRFLLVPLFPVLAALIASGCDDPCLSLARTLCRCERTETEQISCIQRVEAVAVPNPTPEEQDCCVQLLESCNCDALGDGDLAACGIAQEEDESAQRQCLVSESREPG